MITYDKLWESMKQKGVTKYALREKHGIDQKTLARLQRNENVETKTLARLCEVLDCRLEDIAEYVQQA
jgi:DNA-binding Xre family transcriptional regulator